MELNKSKYLNLKKKNPYFEACKEIADKLNEPVKKWLGRFTGWQAEYIFKLKDSAEKMSKDQNLTFKHALNIHLSNKNFK